MTLAYKLVSFLGSPFVNGNTRDKINFSAEEKLNLYKIAYNNKVGLFFLQRLKDIGDLSPLDDKYALDMERYDETLRTATNLSSIISEFTNEFALFKFLKPYPHTPSDVDVLFFLSKNNYVKTVDYLLNNGYFKIDECPSQAVVYDLRGGYEQMDTRTVGGKKGGKYYIDLYKEVSASHFIYMDKEKLQPYITSVNINGKRIQTLLPEADLVVVLTHSIVPEQLFTLGDYYSALYYIRQMDTYQLDKLIQIFSENKVTKVANASLTIISFIHKKIHGFVPDKINYLLETICSDSMYANKFMSDDFDLPYRYNNLTLISVIFERMMSKNGLKSIFIQGVHMLNPRLAKWVIYNIIWRRKRETY
ncbi:MAG TPA: nucleotidyltransferase family protein [Candidatus Methanofastidiosum sp.]|nr:nucleotidyltransferase family protein [Methanofastidiosum sp.]